MQKVLIVITEPVYGSENPYNEPYTHWPNFKYFTPFLKPTGA